MRRMSAAVGLLVTGVGLWTVASGARPTGAVFADGNDGKVAIRDDCDPNDWPGPPPGGGCELEDGDVTVAEFNGELSSPLSLSVIGHQAWRNDPAYLKIEEGETVKVKNKGGRSHTFTEVANFGGGRVPPFNQGLDPPPECLNVPQSPPVAPGAAVEVTGLGVGNHRFQCCFHPWMRALIKVKAEEEGEEETEKAN